MKNLALYVLATFLLIGCSNNNIIDLNESACDNGTFVGNVFLSTQQEVEEFGAKCYSKINGSLTIGIPNTYGDLDILDLSPLSSLTEIYTTNNEYLTGGRLLVHLKNLPSLYGLHNITSVGTLNIAYCFELTNFRGLDSLIKIGGFPELQSGLIGPQSLLIRSNPGITSLDGLDNLELVANDVRIYGNSNLKDIDALEHLTEVRGVFTTSGVNTGISTTVTVGNINLNDLCGISNLIVQGTYGDIEISGNAFNPTVQDIIDGNCTQ